MVTECDHGFERDEWHFTLGGGTCPECNEVRYAVLNGGWCMPPRRPRSYRFEPIVAEGGGLVDLPLVRRPDFPGQES